MKTAFEEFAQQNLQSQQVKPALQSHQAQQAKEVMRAKLAQRMKENQGKAPAKVNWMKLFKLIFYSIKSVKKVVFFFKAIVYLFVAFLVYSVQINVDWSKVHSDVREEIKREQGTISPR